MNEWPTKLKSLILSEFATVHDAMAAIDLGAQQIALVVDGDGRLRATVTDGDIRRALLRGVGLDAPVSQVMHSAFTAVTQDMGREAALILMQARGLHHVPIVDTDGRLVDLAVVDDKLGVVRRDTRVILMAGGLGTRLRPLTETVPKPMLPVGGKPILELILRKFIEQGFHDFTIALNYKGEMIRDHFSDGSRFNARIDYVEETKQMGTAGALSLLETRPDGPFIVMNGDLLTTVSFDLLERFHRECGAVGTMCARNYPIQVPYGVIEMEGAELRRIVEKPTYSHFVNAGIYVLSPEALDHMVAGEFLDMPTLFERIMAVNHKAAVFPIEEYWIDIGRPDDLDRARTEHSEMFSADEDGE
ncbi:MAG: alcohol dehydrogenase [Rhodobacterales bacterium RIFCSPHIGHO2_02_FULL_62_130]|nr:MAG: alcohol dehydrogenase [Rhodobacterales bacterium RIFCSPHIGHO2_02_FULL_62_130]OHC60304.1 MAG: alcohol dehydrogenase [Rhodobacterales bacterium RIFCSPHIGHO2_12_FULL_62_75]HCZ01552.1 alcohol dehydrogenase [Rhodobacter sp.]